MFKCLKADVLKWPGVCVRRECVGRQLSECSVGCNSPGVKVCMKRCQSGSIISAFLREKNTRLVWEAQKEQSSKETGVHSLN